MKNARSACLVLVGIVSTFLTAIAGDSSTKPLKTVLNSKGYMLADPAINYPYPGGFLVANNKSTSFIDLPSNISTPSTQDVTADFFAEKQNKKFSLTAILTGMAALIGGNPGAGFGHTSNLTFQELKATGARITYAQALSILNNENAQSTLNKWLSTKNTRVFIIASVLKTNKLSISTDSAWNGDLSFNGSPVSKCADASSGSSSNSSSNSGSGSSNSTGGGSSNSSSASQATSGNSGAQGSNSPSSPSGASSNSGGSNQNSNSSNSSTATSNSSSQPGGELHLCISNSTTVSMNSDGPLVFAASAYEITKDKATGALNIDPILGNSPSGTFEEQVISQKKNPTQGNNILKKLNSEWQKQSWP
jgi:hypothetical protein